MDLAVRLREWHDAIEGDFTAPIEAARFVEEMEQDHPEELKRWMRERTVRFVAVTLARMERGDRQRALHLAPRRAFAEADDEERLGLFRIRFVINEKQTRRPLAKMTAADLHYVADNYEAEGKHALVMAAFLRAVAKKVKGKRTVAKSMTEEEVEKIAQKFLPGLAPVA